jgi:hypothetical protein
LRGERCREEAALFGFAEWHHYLNVMEIQNGGEYIAAVVLGDDE